MDILVNQEINNEQFNVFIRDLSLDLNANIKYIVEDSLNENIDDIYVKKNYNKNKKKVMKKADIIRQQQLKIKNDKIEKDDLIKINYYIDNFKVDNIYNNLNNIVSKKGINTYKLKLLEKLWNNSKLRKSNMENIMGLYFELKTINEYKENEILNKITKKLSDYDIKLYILKSMGHLLPPLNIWGNNEKKLEKWQLDAIKLIKQNKSILVRAPTSSGKSFVGMSTPIIHKKVAYICPANPVVYQVGAHFTKMGFKVHYLCDNLEYNHIKENVNVFLGTPKVFENMLYKLNFEFDYAVFDEIHGLNKTDDGDIYENLIKLIKCPFIALSATIKNINKLYDIFKNLNPEKDIHLIQYDKRFINQQRWYWNNNNLVELHPLSCINNKNIQNLLEYNLPFSPKDLAVLWETIDEEFEDLCDNDDELYDYIDNMSPDNYFNSVNNDKILNLDQSKDYELFLKTNLIKLNKNYPNNISNIINKFNKSPILNCDNNNIIKFLKETKKNKMLPMIMFNTNINNCIDLFKYIHNKLILEENEHYPYYYDILNKKNELYNEYIEKLECFKSKIKINKKSTDATSDIDNKINNFNEKEKYNYISEIQKYYQSLLDKLENNNCKNNISYKNLNKEYNEFINNPDFCQQNIYKKHPEFCFTDKEPMSDNKIREIRYNIKKTLGVKLDYNHILLQLLKRGIGLYLDEMPNEYNWIVQKLLSSKDIGIVISDRTLCLGIDCPVLSSCLFGSKDSIFTKDDYLQMSGRAGRRGFDTKGNIIFYNIDFNNLMLGELPDIDGNSNNINDNYNILKDLNKNINVNDVYLNFINNDREIIKVYDNNFTNQNLNKLLWRLRKYNNAYKYIDNIKNIERTLLQINNTHDKQIYILNIVNNILFNNDIKIIEIYKNNNIKGNIYTNISKLKEINNIVMITYNYLTKVKYMILKNELYNIHINLKKIIINNSGINYFA